MKWETPEMKRVTSEMKWEAPEMKVDFTRIKTQYAVFRLKTAISCRFVIPAQVRHSRGNGKPEKTTKHPTLYPKLNKHQSSFPRKSQIRRRRTGNLEQVKNRLNHHTGETRKTTRNT